MTRPLIALVTDFGLQDHYVGVMKGVMLGLCPDAQLVDISHGIPPQDIVGAALELEAAYRYFPPGTVFLVVVDPGVGSARRALAIDTGAHRFVGPDNGVLALAATATSGRRVVELINPQYARPTISLTFEGRDRFAPAAAWLASGVDVSAFGTGALPYAVDSDGFNCCAVGNAADGLDQSVSLKLVSNRVSAGHGGSAAVQRTNAQNVFERPRSRLNF